MRLRRFYSSNSQRHTLWSISKYLFFGTSAFIIDFILLWVFVSQIHFAPWLAASLAFVISTAFAFYSQKYFTFHSSASTKQSLPRYLALWFVNMVFTATVVQLFDNVFDLYLVGKVCTVAITTLWNYPIMQNWVYITRSLDIDAD